MNFFRNYNYNDPKRTFAEPLQRYTLIPIWLGFLSLSPFVVISIINDDGGASLNGTGFDMVAVGILGIVFLFVVAYTIGYIVRRWHSKEKWNMEYL